MKRVLSWAALLFFVTAIGETTESEKKGIVTYSDGQVKRKGLAVEEWTQAPVNTEILTGDMVRTYSDSRAELDLAQIDIVRLAPRTTIDVVKLYEETKEKQVATQINVQEGEIWGSIHKIENQTKFDVSAPIAAAAITGTIFRLNVAPDSTTLLKVYSGEVHVTNAPEKTNLEPRSIIPHQVSGPHQISGPREVTVEEWMYIVKAMQQITIDKKGSVVSKGNFSSQDRGEKNDWVQWNMKRDLLRQQSIQNQNPEK